jgi:RHS repeat-associated protein
MAALLFSGRASLAQLNVDPTLERGLKPYESFEGGAIDSISTNNGNLNLHIPLVSYPQRGGKLHFGFYLKYDNNYYVHTTSSYSECTNPPYACTYGDAVTGPLMEIVPDFAAVAYESGILPPPPHSPYATVVTSDGSQHEIASTSNGWRSIDATGYLCLSNCATLVDHDGIQYGSRSANGDYLQLKDPDGNLITGVRSPPLNNISYTDTMGRVVAVPPSLGLGGAGFSTDFSNCTGSLPTVAAYLWSLPGYQGQMAYKICYATVYFGARQCTKTSQFGVPQCGILDDHTWLIQSIVLPNNTAWTFQYDSDDPNNPMGASGNLLQVTFPTGGYIKYTWGAHYFCQSPSSAIAVTYSYTVATRLVNANDGTGDHLTTYSFVNANPASQYQTMSVDALGNKTLHTITALSGGCSFYETQTQNLDSSGNPIRTIATDYSSTVDPFYQGISPTGSANTVPIRVTTTWPNGNIWKVETDYDSGVSGYVYGVEVAKREYDYGSGTSGPLLRTTKTSYAWQSPNPNYSSYLSNNLLDLPSQVSVFAGAGSPGACGVNGAAACTTYGYDESGLQSSGVTEQHVTGETLPGDQTSVQRWLNGSTTATTNCNVSVSNGYLVSNRIYYDTGEVQKSTDPCTYPTTYLYSSSSYGAFPTTVTNALSQSMNYGYDFNTGVVTSIQDSNLQTTTKAYDILARLTSVTYPDGGSTSYCYTDMGGPTCSQSGAPYKVVVTKAITSSPVLSETSTVVFDGLGRLSQTQLNSDAPSTTYTLTRYDALGRESKVYSPSRCSAITTNCGETTWGYTTTNYDPLSRITSVVEQDGSLVRTDYSAFPCTTVTDETGKSRKSCVDGLGRMTGVWEAPSGTNYETDYQYDVLGNLIYVNQKGSNTANARTRTFVYDSLSELTSATNPESGNILYAYDADGNVITKNAPLPNQTGSSTVVATNVYDKLNRLTKRGYNDGKTPQVQFAYDGNSLTGCTKAPPVLTDPYPIGRRTSMCDGSGATSWHHDQMGRIMQDDRFIGSVTPGRFVNYGYTLDGSPKYVTTPPLKTIGYTYNGAGRVIQAIDSTDGINFVTNATYAPPGGLTTMTMGAASGFNGIVTTNSFNDRLQPILLSAASPTGTVFSECFDFHLGVAVNTAPCSFSASSAGDNGNVFQVVNNRDNTRSQNFTYDSLNRIASAYSTGTQWGETFNLDSWGNLTNESAMTGKTMHEGLNTSAGTNNRLTGFGYDAAGNMTSNGSTSYVYDAENRLIWTSGFWTSGYRYLYDGDGQRVEKCLAATSTTACPTSGTNGTLYWRGTGSDPLDESDLSGNALEEYVFFNGQRVARRDVSTNSIHYYFSDHLGSHGVIENATGSVCEQDIDYYPYGGVEHDYCPAPTQNYKFTGKERDAESGLDYFGARYNASTMGRFMSPDPGNIGVNRLNPQSWNAYSYSLNNPLSLTDPTGLYVCEDSEKCDSKNDQAFAKSLADAQTAANNLTGDDKAAAQRAIDSYGAQGVDNGVNVRFDSNVTGGVTEVSGVANGDKSADNPTGQNINVTFNPNAVGGDFSGGLVGHEGSHVADASAWVASGFSPSMNPTNSTTEFNAYHVQFDIGNALLNMKAGPGGSYTGYFNVPPNGQVDWKKGDTFKVITPDLQQKLKENYQNLNSPAFTKGAVLQP